MELLLLLLLLSIPDVHEDVEQKGTLGMDILAADQSKHSKSRNDRSKFWWKSDEGVPRHKTVTDSGSSPGSR